MDLAMERNLSLHLRRASLVVPIGDEDTTHIPAARSCQKMELNALKELLSDRSLMIPADRKGPVQEALPSPFISPLLPHLSTHWGQSFPRIPHFMVSWP